MALVRESGYDEVFDSQSHFRDVLDSMARPGKVNKLDSLPISVPHGIEESTVYASFALLNRDVSYYCSNGSSAIEDFIRVNTGCLPGELQEADFIIAKGTDIPEMLEFAKEGLLTYPETGATFIVEVTGVSSSEIGPALKLSLSGPGIDGERTIWVSGWRREWVEILKEKNSEYPLGVDTILSFKSHTGEAKICCLPRSTQIKIL